MLLHKSIDALRAEHDADGLRRALGPVSLVLLGIGCIVGAGDYVMTGMAAAHFAGPAVVLSFVIAASACFLIGLCYAELSSVLPSAGASYTYAYACLGERAAFVLGWMLLLEFGLGSALLAVGFSGYLASVLADFGIHLPAALVTGTLQMRDGGGVHRLVPTASLNLVALLALVCVAAVLIRGIRESAAVNSVLVAIKLGVLFAFIAFGFTRVHPANWHPFVPPNEGGFRFGVSGIFRAASMVFFAYLGFEAVATSASEARKPQRDVPVGILGALAASTLLYAAVALVMTGLISFRSLDVPDPIAVAVQSLGTPGFAIVIKLGALTGLASVLLVNTYAQSRIGMAMAADGLLPPVLARVHPRLATPASGTAIIAAISAVMACSLPLSLLSDLVSIGTAVAFLLVACCVMGLRGRRPDLPRPFRVPFGGVTLGGIWFGVVPVLALLASLLMMAPVLIDLAIKARHGDWMSPAILALYGLGGAALYLGYSRRHSGLRKIRARDKEVRTAAGSL